MCGALDISKNVPGTGFFWGKTVLLLGVIASSSIWYSLAERSRYCVGFRADIASLLSSLKARSILVTGAIFGPCVL